MAQKKSEQALKKSLQGVKKTFDQSKISPKAKAKLTALSKELGMSEDVLAKVCVSMYRLYKDKI